MNAELKAFLENLLESRRLLPSQLARELGASHPTVGRWLSGEDTPNPKACLALANFSGTPVLSIFKIAGHLPADFSIGPDDALPAFWEYMQRKYPHVPRKFISSILPLVEDKKLWAK